MYSAFDFSISTFDGDQSYFKTCVYTPSNALIMEGCMQNVMSVAIQMAINVNFHPVKICLTPYYNSSLDNPSIISLYFQIRHFLKYRKWLCGLIYDGSLKKWIQTIRSVVVQTLSRGVSWCRHYAHKEGKMSCMGSQVYEMPGQRPLWTGMLQMFRLWQMGP